MREKLLTLPIKELREIAKTCGITNVSSMRKQQLVDQILKANENQTKSEPVQAESAVYPEADGKKGLTESESKEPERNETETGEPESRARQRADAGSGNPRRGRKGETWRSGRWAAEKTGSAEKRSKPTKRQKIRK